MGDSGLTMAKEFKPTREQLVAQATDRNLSVTANAGSGKTMVLVERYLGLLLADPEADPRKIVAITFTKKAAAEMLDKVNRRLSDMLRDAKSSEINHLNKAREKLSMARIMTIHSFCFSLLRDYPIEAGIVPNATEIDQAELIRIVNDAVSNAVEDAIEERDDRFGLMFAKLDRTAIVSLISALLSKRNAIGSTGESIDEKAERVQRVVCEYYSNEIRDVLSAINRVLMGFVPKGKSTNTLEQTLAEIQTLTELESSISTGQCNSYETLSRWASMFSKAVNCLYTKKFTLKVFTVSRLPDGSDGILLSLLPAVQRIDAISSISSSPDYDLARIERDMLEAAENVKALTRLAMDEAFAEKQARNGLDFDDMLYIADSLLTDVEACKFIRKGITHLLVDEFQDTDSVQYSIIKKLVPELEPGSESESGINLFIVGDAKQSIYGFRNADVRVFEQARRDISSLNERLIAGGRLVQDIATPSGIVRPNNTREALGDVALTATFRMQPVISAFVNRVCDEIMDKSLSEYEVEYTPLISSRNIQSFLSAEPGQVASLSGGDSFFGSVDWLVCPVAKKGSAAPTEINSETEYSLVSKYIRKIVNNEKYLVGDEGSRRTIDFGDIAVLSRKKAPLLALTNHLGSTGVPFVLTAGDGFYATQEVLDMVSYLNFLHNPKDDLSVAALLRSPFFGFTDEYLFNTSTYHGETLYEKLSNYAAAPEAPAWVRRAESEMARTIEMSRGLQISDLVIYIIEQSGILGTVPAGPIGDRTKANYEKFTQIARDFENRGFRNLFDFVEELNFLLHHEAKEAEAGTAADSIGVNLMTVHASKGLEFPVVILFDSNSDGRHGGQFAFCDQTGVVFPTKELSEEGFLESVGSPALALAKDIEKSADQAEIKRLLYVAMTRAKDRLVISTEIPLKDKLEEIKLKGFSKLIADGLGISPERLVAGESELICAAEKLNVLEGGLPKEILIRYTVGIINFIEESDLRLSEQASAMAVPEFRFAKLSAEANSEIFSASKMMAYGNSRREFVNRYVFGLPEESSEDEPSAASYESEERIIGSLAGSVIHAVMEKIPRWLGFAGDVDALEFGEAMESALEGVENVNIELLGERVRSECLAVASTPLLRKWQPMLASSLFEYEMYIPVNDDIMMAKIDALIRGADGAPEIWDWKTNIVRGSQGMAALAEKYAMQMKIYAYFVMLLHPGHESYRARLLFTRLAGEGAADEDWTWAFNFSAGDLEQFSSFLSKTSHEMKAINFINSGDAIDYSEGKLEWQI